MSVIIDIQNHKTSFIDENGKTYESFNELKNSKQQGKNRIPDKSRVVEQPTGE